jgi:hypothetical protein
MRLNPLSEALKKVKVSEEPKHQPSLPAVHKTPKPEAQKVVGRPTLKAVNRQAAMIVSPVRDWLAQPLPPEKLPTPESKEVAEIKAELKIERNAHAETRDRLGVVREQLKIKNITVARLELEVLRLTTECRDKDSIIAQLEDLRL